MLLELKDAVFLYVKRLGVTVWFCDMAHIVIYRVVKKSVADKIDKMVRIDTGMILLKIVRMLSDERNDIVHLLLWRLETTFSVCSHNELVSFYSCSIVVQAHIRWIAQAITSVKVIACVLQHVLYVDTCLEIII